MLRYQWNPFTVRFELLDEAGHYPRPKLQHG